MGGLTERRSSAGAFFHDWTRELIRQHAAASEAFLLDVMDRTPPEHRWRLQIVSDDPWGWDTPRIDWTPAQSGGTPVLVQSMPVLASAIPDIIGGVPYNTRPPHVLFYESLHRPGRVC